MTNAIRLCCTYILSKNVPMNTNRTVSGFFMPIFKVEFKRYHFPKSTFGEDLN